LRQQYSRSTEIDLVNAVLISPDPLESNPVHAALAAGEVDAEMSVGGPAVRI
jgi:hypothetical protein